MADTLKGNKHANMKELRVQSNGRPFRIFYAFDPGDVPFCSLAAISEATSVL